MREWVCQQHWPSLKWRAVSVDHYQACAMRERGEVVYSSAARAWAVARGMNKRSKESASNPGNSSSAA